MKNDNNLEKDKEVKINYLRKEIIDKNYNQIDFINFCLSKKENGDNIDNWTLEELPSIVQEFVKQAENQDDYFNLNNIDNDNENRDEVENMNIENELEEIKKNNLFNNLEKENIKKESKEADKKVIKTKDKKGKKEKVIKCRTLEKTVLNNKNIIINIEDSKEISGGLFTKNYISYTVETQPLGWTVQRRYNDFDSLRKLIIKYYPFHIVAPLPNKKIGSKKSDKDYISKTMNVLNDFMNNIIKNESFKASEILISFLSFEDRNQFENKFKELNNQITGNENVDEYKTLDGELTLLYDEKNESYFNNIHKYLKLQDEIFVKINQNLKLFYKNLSLATENMNEIINNFGILHNINANVSMKDSITNTYEGLQNFFKGWKIIIGKQNNIIKNRIKIFFKYINLSNNVYKEIIEKRKELYNKFKSENSKLNLKKEKLFIYKDINKYEIDKEINVDTQRIFKDKKYAFSKMCTNETKNLSKMYKILGYGNKMAINELKELIKENSNKYMENYKKFIEEFYPTINELSEIMNKYEMFLKDINDKKKVNKYKNNKDKKELIIKDKKINNLINNEEKLDNDIK